MCHAQGDELPHANELLKMPGSITKLNVEESGAGEIGAEFISIQRDNKKTVLKFSYYRDVDGKVNKLYSHAGANVSITLQPSQMSIEEFYEEPHESVEDRVNPDGTENIPNDQIEMDEDLVKH
ncbi:hypothetical protein SRABI96_03387 [Peribacillus sp. Bi96]|uniref:hypothetical protein n=1 Tax=Peribacillus sp. Bi96 TaxID=2884273 RepID=UPI001DF67CB0|nr:hypothetical protein SRABI96_03387 [Peribacillus sp. Bi96]